MSKRTEVLTIAVICGVVAMGTVTGVRFLNLDRKLPASYATEMSSSSQAAELPDRSVSHSSLSVGPIRSSEVYALRDSSNQGTNTINSENSSSSEMIVSIPNSSKSAIDSQSLLEYPSSLIKDSVIPVEATKQVSSEVPYRDINLPVFDGWQHYPNDTGYYCGGVGECYYVILSPDYEVNESTLSFFIGEPSSYAELKTAILDSDTCVGVVTRYLDSSVYYEGYVYTKIASEPLFFTISNFDCSEEDMWGLVWSVISGLHINLPENVHYIDQLGYQRDNPVESFNWKPIKTYALPTMNSNTRYDLLYNLPADWKLVEINSVVSSNDPDGKITFDCAYYPYENISVSGEFGKYLMQYIDNGYSVNRLETFVESHGVAEAVQVGNDILLIRILQSNDRIYRCVVKFNPSVCSDEEVWLAHEIYNQIQINSDMMDYGNSSSSTENLENSKDDEPAREVEVNSDNQQIRSAEILEPGNGWLDKEK